jgi:large subunit ribosomal protein L7/L12
MASKSYEKLIEEIGGMTVLELADFVKALETTFGVSAAAPVAVASSATASAAAPAAAEEKSEYRVTLQSSGEAIKTIKALRAAIPTMNLGDAKKAVEGAPTVIAESASKADAQKMKEVLEAAGAKVTLS